jgi:D-glycero-alpha-D-manno-heptose-7-phosphate kinase
VDYDASEEVPSFQDIQDIELSGNFALTKAGLRRRPVNYGLDIFTRSEAPPGSGLGTSAAMGVALIGVLNRVAGVHQTPDQIAETAVALETEELQILSGKQDHYAAALGGVQFMTFRGPHVQSVAMPLDPSLLADLQRQIVLVYTGKSRLSSDLHRHVVQRFESNDPTLLSLFEGLTRIALDVRDALLKGQIDEVGKLVHENWNHQKQLYSGISNPDIEQLCAIGIRAGAIGVKACGAGGGGCLAFVCKDGVESYVAKSLKAAGAEVLRFDIAPQGLMVWSRAESE